MNDDFDRLDDAWVSALAPWREPGRPAVLLFSGGVDSGLLAWELRQRPGTSLLTIGVPGAADLIAAGAAAAEVGLPWSGTEVTSADFARTADRFAPLLAGVPPRRASIFVALASAIERAPARDVLIGQGADELFLGYHHYRNLDPAPLAARARSDLELLLSDDWPRTARIAAALDRVVHAPYLDPAFVRAVDAIPIERRAPHEESKPLLRAWARHRGLPERLAGRPKKAVQFGTGADRELRRPRARPS